MSYMYRGKVYEFAINGQTGKLAGTPPLSKPKLALFSGIIGAAVALAGMVIGGAFTL